MADEREGQKPKSDKADSELDPHLLEWVDRRVRTEFDRDRQFLKDILGAASKIVWAAVSAIAVIIAVAGFHTYKEIDTAIVEAAQKQVAAALRADDPGSPFSTTRDQLVNEAIIDSYLVRLSRAEAANNHDSITADETHRRRMLRLLQSQATDPDIYRDALRVFTLIDGDSKTSEVTYATLRDMLAAKPPYQWLAHDKARRIALLQRLRDIGEAEYLTPGLNVIFRDAESSQDLLAAAYSAATIFPDNSFADALREHCKRPAPQPMAYAALAAVSPADPEIEHLIQTASTPEGFVKNDEAAFHVLSVLLGQSKKENARLPAAKVLMKAILDHDSAFLISPQSDTAFVGRRGGSVLSVIAPQVSLKKADLLNSASQGLIMELLQETAKKHDTAKLLKYIGAFQAVSLPNGLDKTRPDFWMRRPWLIGGITSSIVVADISKGGTIKLNDGRILSAGDGKIIFSTSATGSLFVLPPNAIIEPSMRLVMLPNGKIGSPSAVTAIEAPEKIIFSIELPQSPSAASRSL